jgi:hypothetical protein
MRQALRLPAVARHLLLVGLFALPLTSPLWRWTVVACTHDGHVHSNRVVAMRYAWENGLYLARWLPDVAFGYGYPLFVYREPLPLYAMLIPHLWGLPLPAASNLVHLLSLVTAGAFTYLWVRDILGARAAIVAAVAYMAAPYQLVDALVRGNLPESMALAFMPFLLWIGRRWMRSGSAVPFVVGTAALALFSLVHNISLLLFSPVLGLYLLVVGRVGGLTWPESLARSAIWLGLGLGMTIFYPAGALLEMNEVTLQQAIVTRNNDFRYNFASLAEMAAPASPSDPNLINPPLLFRLGWTTLLLAASGTIRLLIHHPFGPRQPTTASPGPRQPTAASPYEPHHLGWLMLAIAAVYLFFALPLSRPLWEALPLIDFVQFPWRFIGRAALPLAFLAALPFAGSGAGETHPTLIGRWLPGPGRGRQLLQAWITANGRVRRSLLPRFNLLQLAFWVAIAFFILEALPYLYPSACPEEPFPTIISVHRYEHVTGLVGVDPEGSHFPRSVRERPQASALEADYQAGRPPQRFDISRLPAGAEITAAAYRPLAATIHLVTPEPFTARYFSFAFPGWQVKVNGRPTPITPGDPDGLITFAVPAGRHEITVTWQSTPLRSALLAVSLLAVVATIAVTAWLWRWGPAQPAVIGVQAPAEHLRLRDFWLLATLALLLLALKLAVVDRYETIWRRAAPPAVAHSTAVPAAELSLAGFNLQPQVIPAGSTFDVDLVWQVAARPTAKYQSNLWLAGGDGLMWSDKETQRPRLFESPPATDAWQPGQWAWDSREVAVLAGTPPGRYDLVLTLFDLASLQPLTLRDGSGAVVGPTAVIGQVTVTNPSRSAVVQPQYALNAAVENLGVRLLGYNQDRQEAAPGDPVLLTFFWQREGERPAARFTVELVDELDQTVFAWTERSLIRPGFAATDWPAAAPLRDQHALRLPAALADGRYRFFLQGNIELGYLDVDGPERFLEAPAAAVAVGAALWSPDGSERVTVSHYALEHKHGDGEASLTVFWQTSTGLNEGYHVFVHLVDKDGRLMAQSDGIPASWSRPTTGWIPGEYVADNHLLGLPEPLPAGPLALRVGLYAPGSGQRFQGETADFVSLPFTGGPDE